MESFTNNTPFAVEALPLLDERGRDLLVLAVKGTWRISPDGILVPLDEQIPISFAGEYWGDPETSSFKYEPEVALPKLSTDIVLIGHAFPQEKGATEIDIELVVGPLSKTVRAFGRRYWYKRLGFERISQPEPIDRLPLRYEFAFGGWDRSSENPEHHTVDARNPVGVGFRHPKLGRFEEGRELPGLENPASLIRDSKDAPQPAAFGFIGPSWEPRRNYIGTYDQSWMDNRMPLLPEDFDRRYFNAAHPDLVAPNHLIGGDSVTLTNASMHGRLGFQLPQHSVAADVTWNDYTDQPVALALDTVIINTDDDLVIMIWRGGIDVHGRLHQVREVAVHL